MNHILSRLIMYGDMPKDSILMQMANICAQLEEGTAEKTVLRTRVFQQVKRMLMTATDYGFNKNLWQNYLTFVLIMDENPFSLTCEKIGATEGASANHFAKNDFQAFYELFHYDFTTLENELGIDCFTELSNYRAISKPELMYNKNVSEKVQALSDTLAAATDADAFFDGITAFYKDFGVGMFGLNKAFRIYCPENSTRVEFRAINNMDQVVLDDLIGMRFRKRNWWTTQKPLWKAERPTMCCCLVTAEPVNPPVSRRSSTNFMIRDCA